ncbi:TonB-dependent receptor [Candidatus Moduliflexus flocculans]|uniref:TonB-dependent receptor n=1 Tax=Candidatus Moduliflexus flocculans TaxID=1499966 RepID=A0A081BME8_9BACT|nr:TonB-dependent receptor [Candidatus Moduliflexus flocculans]
MAGTLLKHVFMMNCACLILTCAAPIVAQEEVVLGPIVVTAEHFPTQEKETSRYVSVISSEQLQETGANNLSDALRRIGGLAYKAYGPLGVSHGGMNSKLSIRGLENGELVLMNGVPIQGAAGHAYNLNTTPINHVERVEVLKGAASTLYGAGAMTGVINIITKQRAKESAVNAAVEFGNEAYQHHSAEYGHARFTLGIDYSHLAEQERISRSISKKYRYDTDATNEYALHLNVRPIEHLFLDYLGSFVETGFHKVYEDGSSATERTDQDHAAHFADLRYETETLRMKTFFSYDLMKRDEYTDQTEPDDRNKNYNYGATGDYRFTALATELTAGGEYAYHGADYNNQYGKHARNDYALFLLGKKTLVERLTLLLGAREQFINADDDGADYDMFLPTAGVAFQAIESLNLFANAGKAFRAPTFNHQYYESSFMVGNPDLKPESGWTYEAGAKWDIDRLRLRLAGFFMDYDDKIVVDNSQSPQTYFNAGMYHSTGAEWEIDVSPFINSASEIWQNLSFSTTGYWADPVAEDADGEEYQAGPKMQVTTALSYLSDTLTLRLSSVFLGQRENALDDAFSVDLYGRYKLYKGYLTVAVDNIFDEEIQVSGNMEPTASNQYAYYEMSRLFKIGYQLSF